MEMMQVSALVERLTDEQLMQEMQRPSGMAPLQVIIGELQRRSAMRGGKPRGYAAGGPVTSERSQQIWEALQAAGIGGRLTSADRTPEHNRRVGGVDNSWHVRRDAVDWVNQDLSMPQVRAAIAQAGLPKGELLNHDAGSGMHFHYSPEGAPLDGSAVPTPPPAPIRADGNFPDPEALTGAALGIGGTIAERMGLPSQVPGLPAQFAEIQGMMPDSAAAYDNAIKRLQQSEKDAMRSSRGRPFIDAGLAMMTAQTPDFMSALGQGGQAGFSARDRIQEQQRGLMNAVIQAQLAKSQTEAQNARASLESAASIGNSQRGSMTQAYATGAGIAEQGGRVAVAAAEDNTRRELSATEIAARERIAQIGASAQLEAIRESARLGRYENKSPQERLQSAATSAFSALSSKVGERIMEPDPANPGRMISRTYTPEDASRDAMVFAQSVFSQEQMMNGQPPAQTPAAPVRSNGPGPRIVSVSPLPSGD